jgi:sigma-B regulation protein RsbU (phosphoserine phosphatase)
MPKVACSSLSITVSFTKNGRSIHINAGHNPPVLFRAASRTASLMSQGGRAIGWFPHNPLSEVELQLESGDVIVYYTDGLTDAENPNGENFGEVRLCRVVEDAVSSSAADVLHHILHSVEQFGQGVAPFDDLTLMVVRYVG